MTADVLMEPRRPRRAGPRAVRLHISHPTSACL